MWSLWWGHRRSLGEALYEVLLESILGSLLNLCIGFCLRAGRQHEVPEWGLSMDSCGRYLCKKSLLRNVSVKSLCLVSVCFLHFWSYCTLWKTEQWKKGKGTCFFLFSSCSISITCSLQVSHRGLCSGSPTFPELTGKPWRGSSPWVPTPQVLAPFSLLCPFSRLSWKLDSSEAGTGSRRKQGCEQSCVHSALPPQLSVPHMLRSLTGMGDGVSFLLPSESGAYAGAKLSTVGKILPGAVSTVYPAHGRMRQSL